MQSQRRTFEDYGKFISLSASPSEARDELGTQDWGESDRVAAGCERVVRGRGPGRRGPSLSRPLWFPSDLDERRRSGSVSPSRVCSGRSSCRSSWLAPTVSIRGPSPGATPTSFVTSWVA